MSRKKSDEPRTVTRSEPCVVCTTNGKRDKLKRPCVNCDNTGTIIWQQPARHIDGGTDAPR